MIRLYRAVCGYLEAKATEAGRGDEAVDELRPVFGISDREAVCETMAEAIGREVAANIRRDRRDA